MRPSALEDFCFLPSLARARRRGPAERPFRARTALGRAVPAEEWHPAPHRAGTSPLVATRPQVACLQDPIQNALRPALRGRERAVVIKQAAQHCARGGRCISPPPRPLPGTDSQHKEDLGSLSPPAAEPGRERKTQHCLQPHTALHSRTVLKWQFVKRLSSGDAPNLPQPSLKESCQRR